MGGARPLSNIVPNGRDLEQSWIFIQDRLYQPFSLYTVREPTEYIDCYSAIVNILRHRHSRPQAVPTLYYIIQKFLHDALQNGLSSISSSAENSPSSNVLTNYVSAWEQFLTGAKYNNNVLSDMNRHWIERQRAEGVTDVWPLITVHLLAWKRDIFDVLKDELVDAMKAERDSAVLKKAEESYEVLKKEVDGKEESMEDFQVLLRG